MLIKILLALLNYFLCLQIQFNVKSIWYDYHTNADDWEVENISSLEIVNLSNHSDTEIFVTNIAHNNNLVVLKIDPMEDFLVMLRHFTHIGAYVRMKDHKIVDLNGFASLDSIVRFK